MNKTPHGNCLLFKDNNKKTKTNHDKNNNNNNNINSSINGNFPRPCADKHTQVSLRKSNKPNQSRTYSIKWQIQKPYHIVPLLSILNFANRQNKNRVEETSGWNDKTLLWCLNDAKKQGLKEADFWGGFAIDEMKIQVLQTNNITINNLVLTQSWSIVFLDLIHRTFLKFETLIAFISFYCFNCSNCYQFLSLQ